jgi:hypothetical protein
VLASVVADDYESTDDERTDGMTLDEILKRDTADDPDFSKYDDLWLLTELGRTRALCSVETDERVRVFLGMRIEALIVEMDRRSLVRIERRLTEGLS